MIKKYKEGLIKILEIILTTQMKYLNTEPIKRKIFKKVIEEKIYLLLI